MSRTPKTSPLSHTFFFNPRELQLFVNGILHHAIPLSLTSFSLDLPTSAPVGVADPTPVLFLGQVTQDFNRSSNLPSFTGCMRDLTIDLWYKHTVASAIFCQFLQVQLLTFSASIP